MIPERLVIVGIIVVSLILFAMYWKQIEKWLDTPERRQLHFAFWFITIVICMILFALIFNFRAHYVVRYF